ncbi:hypothetical protein [Leptospira kmetyi]|nr:hypothetical protein [Leptospira kmetyi]
MGVPTSIGKRNRSRRFQRLQSILPTNDIESKTACKKTTAPYIDKAHNQK